MPNSLACWPVYNCFQSYPSKQSPNAKPNIAQNSKRCAYNIGPPSATPVQHYRHNAWSLVGELCGELLAFHSYVGTRIYVTIVWSRLLGWPILPEWPWLLWWPGPILWTRGLVWWCWLIVLIYVLCALDNRLQAFEMWSWVYESGPQLGGTRFTSIVGAGFADWVPGTGRPIARQTLQEHPTKPSQTDSQTVQWTPQQQRQCEHT